jgi:hypothetical protein
MIRSRRLRKDKKLAVLLHAKSKLKKRFGMTLTKERRAEIIDNIQMGRYKLVLKQSRRVSIWQAEIENRLMHIVYDKDRHQIVTFLYPGL